MGASTLQILFIADNHSSHVSIGIQAKHETTPARLFDGHLEPL